MFFLDGNMLIICYHICSLIRCILGEPGSGEMDFIYSVSREPISRTELGSGLVQASNYPNALKAEAASPGICGQRVLWLASQ